MSEQRPQEDQKPHVNEPMENQEQEAQKQEEKQATDHETKDKRGGNHNPNGANQYTQGRNDDRGRKS